MQNIASPRVDPAAVLELEQVLAAAAVAPRVSLADMTAVIDRYQFIRVEGTTLTICVLHLRNGFTVTGESAAASPENFNAEIGQDIAYDNAKKKLGPLLGYALRERLHEESSAFIEGWNRASEKTRQERIARMCHEVNRAYCQFLGDNSQPAWEDAPQWQRESAISGVRLHMLNPDAGPEASHEAWSQQKFADGWKWGLMKDPERKEHPCLVPFNELLKEQQAKDWLFRGVVHAMVGL